MDSSTLVCCALQDGWKRSGVQSSAVHAFNHPGRELWSFPCAYVEHGFCIMNVNDRQGLITDQPAIEFRLLISSLSLNKFLVSYYREGASSVSMYRDRGVSVLSIYIAAYFI